MIPDIDKFTYLTWLLRGSHDGLLNNNFSRCSNEPAKILDQANFYHIKLIFKNLLITWNLFCRKPELEWMNHKKDISFQTRDNGRKFTRFYRFDVNYWTTISADVLMSRPKFLTKQTSIISNLYSKIWW